MIGFAKYCVGSQKTKLWTGMYTIVHVSIIKIHDPWKSGNVILYLAPFPAWGHIVSSTWFFTDSY